MLISEFNEFHKMQCSKIKEECPKLKNWWTNCELNAQSNRSLPTWERQAKNRNVLFEKWDILGNIVLCELGEISKTIQWQACLKYPPEGFLHCSCCVCLAPLPEQRRKIKTQFEIMSVPCYIVRMDHSRGARHGQTQWQYDHWKAKDAKRRAT